MSQTYYQEEKLKDQFEGENVALLKSQCPRTPSSGSTGGTSEETADITLLVTPGPQEHVKETMRQGTTSLLRTGSRFVLSVPRRCLHYVWNTGEACMLIAALMFSFANLMLKLTGGRIPVVEVALFRCSISVLLSIIMGWKLGLLPGWRILGTSRRWGLLVIRGVCGGCALILGYLALWKLPISIAIVISQINPPVTALAAYLFLKEPLGIRGTVGVVLAFLGVLVISRPPIPGISSSGQEWGMDFAVGSIAGVAAAVLSAGAYLSIRKLSSESSVVLGLWLHACTVIISFIPVCIGWPDKTVMPSVADSMLIVTVSVLGFFALIIFTRSFQLLSAGKASALNFTGVLYAYIWDLLIWGTAITLSGIIGTALTLAGVMMVAIRNSKAAPKPAVVVLAPNISVHNGQIRSLGGCHHCSAGSRGGIKSGFFGEFEASPLLTAAIQANPSSGIAAASSLQPACSEALELGAEGGLPIFLRGVNQQHGAAPSGNMVLNPLVMRTLYTCAHQGSDLGNNPSFMVWALHPTPPTDLEAGPSGPAAGAGSSSGDTSFLRMCTYCGDEGLISMMNSVGAVREAAAVDLRRASSCPLFGISPAALVGHEVHS